MANHDAKGMKIYRRILLWLCALTLCGILAAGLWPFNPHPKNEVSWLGNENGLLFGDYGTILSASAFRAVNPGEELPCSFEIWLEPGATSIQAGPNRGQSVYPAKQS